MMRQPGGDLERPVAPGDVGPAEHARLTLRVAGQRDGRPVGVWPVAERAEQMRDAGPWWPWEE